MEQTKKIISDEKGVRFAEETKQRKASTTTTIKSFNNNISKLIVLKMVNADEAETLKQMQKNITNRWLSLEMGIETSTETTK